MTALVCGIRGTKVEIRQRTMGVEAGSVLADALHGLATGETFTLRLRVFADKVEVEVLKTDAATVGIEATTSVNRQNTWVGFESDVNGAVVLSFSGFGLSAQQAQASEVFWVLAGGNLYACYDGTSLQLLSSAMVSPDVVVGADYADGHVYFVGGGRSWDWNVLTRTVSPASADGHPTTKLPGATTTGTTTATIVRSFRARMAYAGIEAEAQNVYWSAIAEPLNLDTGELTAGHAVAFGVGRGLRLGQPIVAMERATENTLFIGCTSSMYRLLGDPGDESAELPSVSETVGVAGRNAVSRTAEGVIAFVSHTGLYVMGSADPVNISRSVIAGGIAISATDAPNINPVVIRDPVRHGLHVWLTRTGGGGTFWWYDETVGGYEQGRGGFWQETYPSGLEPVCATLWKNQVVIGTRNGRLVRFSDTAKDDLGTAIESVCPLTVVTMAPVRGEMHVAEAELTLSDGSSDVTLNVYGGATTEDVYSSRRSLLQTVTVSAFDPGVPLGCRSPAVLLEIYSNTAGSSWALEGCEISYEKAEKLGDRRIVTPAAAGSACGPVITSSSTETDSTPGGPGGGTRPTNVPVGPPSAPTDPPLDPEPDTDAGPID
jgi:hypothetical protein